MATSGRQRIKLYKPMDEADRLDDWLYLPETLYAFMLILVISAGAGPYSLDALITGVMNARRSARVVEVVHREARGLEGVGPLVAKISEKSCS